MWRVNFLPTVFVPYCGGGVGVRAPATGPSLALGRRVCSHAQAMAAAVAPGVVVLFIGCRAKHFTSI